MPQRKTTVAELLADGRLQRISADTDEARDLLAHAEAHLASARAIAVLDPEGAYQLLYDAARKAVAADMLVEGMRARADRPGAHMAVVAYAEEALAGHADTNALANFDRMRRSRNRTEYGAVTVTHRQLTADLAYAEEIMRAVRVRVDTNQR